MPSGKTETGPERGERATAYDETLADRIREVLANPDLGELKMFGGLAFMVRGHMVCGVLHDDLMLRLGPHGRPPRSTATAASS